MTPNLRKGYPKWVITERCDKCGKLMRIPIQYIHEKDDVFTFNCPHCEKKGVETTYRLEGCLETPYGDSESINCSSLAEAATALVTGGIVHVDKGENRKKVLKSTLRKWEEPLIFQKSWGCRYESRCSLCGKPIPLLDTLPKSARCFSCNIEFPTKQDKQEENIFHRGEVREKRDQPLRKAIITLVEKYPGISAQGITKHEEIKKHGGTSKVHRVLGEMKEDGTLHAEKEPNQWRYYSQGRVR